jgi:hypothetical protein
MPCGLCTVQVLDSGTSCGSELCTTHSGISLGVQMHCPCECKRAGQDHIHVCVLLLAQARDGVCDDGRYLHNMTRGLPSSVLCDLGTDCEDCGPWKGVQHTDSW